MPNLGQPEHPMIPLSLSLARYDIRSSRWKRLGRVETAPPPPPSQDGPARPPTIREVARAAGVSPMTVSRVLTGRGYVAEQTASRVRDAFERLEYRPNPVARMLRGRHSHLIGVTIPSLTSSVHRGIVAGLEEVLGQTDYQVILGHLQSGRQPSANFVELAHRQHCDGYVIVPSRADASAAATHLDRPAVMALSSVPGLLTDAVLTDGRAAACAATIYLLERFGAPVAFVGLDSELSHDRSILDGYRDALALAGREPWVLTVRSGQEGTREGVRAMLASPAPPRAFLFASTLLIFEGLGELVQDGLRIGEDVGVVAVASEERPWTALLPVPLPLLVIPAREIGRRAASLLLRRLGQPASEPELDVLPMEFLAPGQGG
jgi:DNA-binding LacI/PurR family transcriptional regulator